MRLTSGGNYPLRKARGQVFSTHISTYFFELIVDDRASKLIAMEALFADFGENVVCVSSGKDALRQLLERDFAVILLDVNMPDMDGFETAALIRQRPRLQHIPIIFMTAGSDDTHALQGR
jgi:CheY-like chemotaxis protein